MSDNNKRAKRTLGSSRVTKRAKTSSVSERSVLQSDSNRSVRSVILEQNRRDMELLGRAARGEVSPSSYSSLASERHRGQWQFSTCSHNIRASGVACKHACSYCYVVALGKRWGRVETAPDMEDPMPTDPRKVGKTWKSVVGEPKNREMVFFPSSHDVFSENASDYAASCKGIIDAGHEILYVTKSSLESVTAVVTALEALGDAKYLKGIAFYVTVGTDDEERLRVFEKNTPGFEERLETVRFLRSKGVDVNVMMEPYLSDPVPIIPRLLEILPESGTVAIGQMNYTAGTRLSEDEEEDRRIKGMLEELYSRENVMRLFRAVDGNPRLFLKKDSIRAVLKALVAQQRAIVAD